MSGADFLEEEVAAVAPVATSGSLEDAIGVFAEQLGGVHSDAARAEAQEWVDEACQMTLGKLPSALGRERRALVTQRCLLVASDLAANPNDLAFTIGARGVVREAVAARFGASPDGPPWRVDPTEASRPTWIEWRALADFSAGPAENPDEELLDRLADEIFDPGAATRPLPQ